MSNSRFSEEFLEETKRIFCSMSSKELTEGECIVLAQNMISLEMYLRELKRKYEKRMKK
ncbi:MAG: hypothetical protein IKC10_01500 [Alphaproteobacteria bacterium]|nr:hypothetical protein [Alphaproteobacteria bacterium]